MDTTQNDALQARLDTLSSQMAWLMERQKKQEELVDELLLPVAREAMKTATGRLEDLEKKGYFAFGEELLKVGQRIVESYAVEDVRALGAAVTIILDTVKAVTQHEVMSVVGEATQVIALADQTQPIGLVGMVRATHHPDVQRGMAVLAVHRHSRALERVGDRRVAGGGNHGQHRLGRRVQGRLAVRLSQLRQPLPVRLDAHDAGGSEP